MTRGKWVALAVGVAVIAVLVLNGPAVWMAVAYEERRWTAGVGVEPGKKVPDYAVILRKRPGWLPGPDRMVWCAFCVESNHRKCPREVALLPLSRRASRMGVSLDREETELAGFRSCDCPHPSHAQESR